MTIDKEKNTQILVTFTNEQMKQIDDYWHNNRFKNRNETIRELVSKGLEKEST